MHKLSDIARFLLGRQHLTVCLCLKTAALAQKNSEATRALAVQEDILEKELGETQKVLLAMQVSVIFSLVADKLK